MPPSASAVILFVATFCGTATTGDSLEVDTDAKFGVWQNRASLDPGGVMTLWWNSTPVRQEDTFTLLLEGATHGYLGFGLSPYTGTMAGADLVVAWVDGGKVPHIRDYWADQNGSPTLDAIQDWRVLWSRENDTHTSVVLTRSKVTGHPRDLPIEVGRTRIIYAWSTEDPEGAPRYHGKEQQGTKTLELLSKSMASNKQQNGLLFSLFLYIQVSRSVT